VGGVGCHAHVPHRMPRPGGLQSRCRLAIVWSVRLLRFAMHVFFAAGKGAEMVANLIQASPIIAVILMRLLVEGGGGLRSV